MFRAVPCTSSGGQIVLLQLHEQGTARNMLRILCDFDRASSLICGKKMSTRCNRGFYCRPYCLLNMFRAPLCPSSGAQEYYTVVAACGIFLRSLKTGISKIQTCRYIYIYIELVSFPPKDVTQTIIETHRPQVRCFEFQNLTYILPAPDTHGKGKKKKRQSCPCVRHLGIWGELR